MAQRTSPPAAAQDMDGPHGSACDRPAGDRTPLGMKRSPPQQVAVYVPAAPLRTNGEAELRLGIKRAHALGRRDVAANARGNEGKEPVVRPSAHTTPPPCARACTPAWASGPTRMSSMGRYAPASGWKASAYAAYAAVPMTRATALQAAAPITDPHVSGSH